MSEIDEIRLRYARRDPETMNRRYSMLNPEVWQAMQERQRALIQLLRSKQISDVERLRVLEVGCGTGTNLLELIRLGFSPENLVGNELLPERVAHARRNLPMPCELLQGDALQLAIPPATFDIVYQSTVFSSILDLEFQRRLADAMWSWVKPGGSVLWYDFIYDNPRNPDVRGVKVRRILELFPGGRMVLRRVTLAPPISRRVCRLHSGAYSVFNALPILRSHVMCLITKPS